MLAKSVGCGKAVTASARGEQLIDVEGQRPLVDDAVVGIDQLTIRPEEERYGRANAAVCSGDLSIAVEEMIEFELELIKERLSVGLVVRDVDAYELDLISIFCERFVQQRGLRSAGQTPRCPNVDHGRPVDGLEMLFEFLGGDSREVGTIAGPRLRPVTACGYKKGQGNRRGQHSFRRVVSWHVMGNTIYKPLMPLSVSGV